MASSSGLLCDEQFLCSICLDVFTQPVSTPCGHNYCKACITEYWDSSDLTQCPLCNERFCSRPQLQVNTGFRDMVEHFSCLRVKSGDEVLAKPGEVPCDVCLGPKLKAQKTCLVCLASYCQPHLEPHQRATSLKKHKLIDPVPNLEDRVCKKHDKMLEFFCHADQMCVCFMCLKDGHVMHEAVPLEHAFREKKAWLENTMSEVKMMENTKSRSVKEIRSSVEQRKEESEKEIADIVEVFATLVTSLKRSQVKLIELIQKMQKAAETEAEDCISRLEQEVAELRRRSSEMEQLLQTEDHIHLLQSWPSIHFPADLFNPLSHSAPPLPQDFFDSSKQIYVGMVKKSVAQMEKMLVNDMEMLIHEVRLSDGCEAAKQADADEKLMSDGFIKEEWNPPQDKLMMIQQCNAVNVTMDAYGTSSSLMVSEDGKRLKFRERGWFFPVGPTKNFYTVLFAPAIESFSSGRFYYEVQVSGSKYWQLGVAKESIRLKECWTLIGMYTEFEERLIASDNVNSECVHLRWRPQTVGVFVDYEKGEISFYDVDARSLIYSFTGCTFTETTPTLKGFLYSMVGTSSSNRPKLCPIFGIFGDDPNDELVITPIAHAT